MEEVDLPETVYTDQALKHAMLDASGAKILEATVRHLNAVYMYVIALEGRIDELEERAEGPKKHTFITNPKYSEGAGPCEQCGDASVTLNHFQPWETERAGIPQEEQTK